MESMHHVPGARASATPAWSAEHHAEGFSLELCRRTPMVNVCSYLRQSPSQSAVRHECPWTTGSISRSMTFFLPMLLRLFLACPAVPCTRWLTAGPTRSPPEISAISKAPRRRSAQTAA